MRAVVASRPVSPVVSRLLAARPRRRGGTALGLAVLLGVAAASHSRAARADVVNPTPLAGFSNGQVFQIAHTAAGAATLTDFQVRVVLNTATEIAAGRMKADCSDLRVYTGNGCVIGTPVNFWVADGTCNTTTTNVWLGLPLVRAGSTTSFTLYWGNPTAVTASNGTAVFPIFFDDFNGPAIDTTKWNLHHASILSQSGGRLTTSGGASALWTKAKVMKAGETVFGVRTNAQAASGADIEYGAATLLAPLSGVGDIHWSTRTYSGVLYMAYDVSLAFVGRQSSAGTCQNVSAGTKWTNNPGDTTFFQTEFFYEILSSSSTRFGIYDKFGAKRQTTMGFGGCMPNATESAYWQFDHSDGLPNPSSSLDYAYVRKYANPDPVQVGGTALSAFACPLPDGSGPCTQASADLGCQSQRCSSAGVCIPFTGGCYVDADCAAGNFCDRSTLACKAKLAVGGALPSDGLHNGQCTDQLANVACLSGACNATTNTCAGPNGAACNGAGQCTSNICGSNGLCGASNGTTGCTAVNASTYCQSGACSTSGACVPAGPGGCYADSDCSQGYFCRRDTFTCTALLGAGALIPDDGLHGGVCSPGNANALCASGQCNGTTNTCAGPLGAPCASAAQCVANVCGANGQCGYPDGNGTCSAATGSALCQSGTCSAAGVCIPSGAGRCWVDNDCSASQFCDRTSLQCLSLLATGTPVPNDGLHDGSCAAAGAVCASGLCNAMSSTCAASQGGSCTTAAQCVGNLCGSNARCGIAIGDGPCIPNQPAPACQTGQCSVAGVCAPGTGGCWVDADCASGQFCEATTLVCMDKLGAGAALPVDRLHDGVCTAALASVVCADSECNEVANTCGRPAGSACASASQCSVNLCNATGACGFGLGEGDCTPGNAGVRCASGTCSSAGVCLSALSGSCWLDADCTSTQYCDRVSATCAPRLAAGVALPNDGLHDGQCTPAAAAALCLTAACNETTDTCASGVGAACTAASGCTGNVCGSNAQCGSVNGAGPCTPGNAADVCQSGACGPLSEVCIPPDANACGSDVECADGQYCDRASLHCAARLPAGAALPDDGAHNTCAAGSNAACASGLCNPSTKTCGAPTGTACTSASGCANNLCGRNNQCGLDAGQPGCTGATAALCQSGVCSASGVCGADGCLTDTDCGASAYCDASVGLCKARLAVGQKLPTDTLHDGKCSAAVATTVCTSAACNAATDECATPNGGTCTANDQCAANVCGSNGKCGLADGQSGCTAATATSRCQSGLCSEAGQACLPVGQNRCVVDIDCAAVGYCDHATLTCAAKLPNGAPIPADGLHDDGCLPGNASAVCSSGACNEATKTCAGPTGSPCTLAKDCSNNTCGKNGLCGLPGGEGPCMAGAGSALCQSGICNGTLGLCMPTNPSGCLVDADCTAGTFCARNVLTCSPKLTAGAPLPSDALHDGTCGAALATLVCATGTCNVVTNTCAGANGTACTTAAACVAGACSAGLCGRADGESCTRNAECRTGLCTAGKCGTGTMPTPPTPVTPTPTPATPAPSSPTGNTIGGSGGCSQAGGSALDGLPWLLAVAAGRLVRRRRVRR